MTSELVVPAPISTSAVAPATAGDPLLQSKFAVPEPPSFLVARPRLTERLARGVREPVTLVVGPAGAGKTQLVAAWAAEESPGYPIGWITLEEEDGQSDSLWAYILEALRRAGVPFAPSFNATADRSFLVRLAAALAEQAEPVVLVLDGVSYLQGQQWATDLEFVLRHAGRMLRLVLAGRWDPPLPLHRYRLAGRLEEVRSEDLAFTADEAAELLALHRVPLSRDGMAQLLQHTEGWAAGLRLFAMALEDAGDAESLIATITGNDATIAEYFVDEVLRIQPAHVRTFLLETSILDTFTPELAGAVTERADSRQLLAALCRQNAFVQHASEGAYRCHRLFAELLEAQLNREAPERIPELHRRAAVWFAAAGQLIEAIGHASAAGDWVLAASVVIEDYAIGRLLVDGRESRLGELLSGMPAGLESPEGAVIAAALALTVRDAETSAAQLERAEELMMTRPSGYSPALALAHLITDAMLARQRDDTDAVLHAAAAAEELLGQTPPAQQQRHDELRMLVLAARGDAQSRIGAVDAAAITLTEVATTATANCDGVRIGALAHLALIEAHRGRLRHAEKLADQATELADRIGLGTASRPVGAELALAWVAMERYDIDTAGRHLRAADPRRIRPADGMIHAAFALIRSRRLQARGELRGALTALADGGPVPGGQAAPYWLTRQLALSRARLLVTMSRPDQALEALGKMAEPEADDATVVRAAALAAAGEAEQAWQLVEPVAGAAGVASPVSLEAWLVLATVAARRGEVDEARGALRQALRAASPESQRRAVQQVWADLRRVLRDDDELAAQYKQLQGAAHAAPAAAAENVLVFEALSKREMEVLEGMAAMLPTEEIAATLYVSVNTVKTHVRSILRKLSASRRNEAVRRARSLGLI
ncbi:LuxR C-terminal-related transcriptional regulator [Actinoplanes sp. NPDC051513]|uniref:LuxR C-terminal-related transcriptional regulator n=1 Tax=Actinoplanes sp. NPDC051513 TaxID=3363908 RepID=UPI0037B115D9